MEIVAGRSVDTRRFQRVPWGQLVHVQTNPTTEATVACRDISRGGICIESKAPIALGRHALISVDDTTWTEERVQLKAHVVWTRLIAGKDRFVAGLRIYHDDAGVGVLLSQLIFAAVLAWERRGRPRIGTLGPGRGAWIQWHAMRQREAACTQ